MAKQYIPKISGLLTEPNPVDAPSNSLSEAENVIIDQNGKVQARHGLNVNQDEASSPFAADYNEAYDSNGQIIPAIGNLTSDSLITLPQYTYVHYSSFYKSTNDSSLQNSFIKFLEFKKSDNSILTGLFVKQQPKKYRTVIDNNNITYLYPNSDINLSNIPPQYRVYQISADSGKLINTQVLPYTQINHVFNKDESIYFDTNEGIAECNVDKIFDWTDNSPYFSIRWPIFPKITHTYKRSSLYANWLNSNHKIGIRITFFRELGYTDKNGQIYESQPSAIYEIANTGKETIPVIMLDYTSLFQYSEQVEQWNHFCKLSHGRKFGINIYRTKSVPIEENLPDEFFQCSESIYFDTVLTGKLLESTDLNSYNWFQFESDLSLPDTPILKINDIITYANSTFLFYNSSSRPTVSSAYTKFVTIDYPSPPLDYSENCVPLRLKVSNYRKRDLYHEYQFTILNNSTSLYTDSLSSYSSNRLVKNELLSKRIKTKIRTYSNTKLEFINISNIGNLYYSYNISYPTYYSTIKFIDTAPAGFLPNTIYHVVSNGNTTPNSNFGIELAVTPNGTPISATSTNLDLVSREIEIFPNFFIDYTIFTRSFENELSINDESLIKAGQQLYTNPNVDSRFYTNYIAPRSQFIIPYKDFYVHAGTENSLSAKLTVIKQPSIEQHSCVPALDSTFYTSRIITFVGPPSATSTFTSSSPSNIGLTNGNAVYFSTTPPAPFVINTYYYVVDAAPYPGSTFKLAATLNGTAITPTASGTATMVYQRWTSANANSFSINSVGFYSKTSTNLMTSDDYDFLNINKANGKLYIESAALGPRRYQIGKFPTDGLQLSNLLNYNTVEFYYTPLNDLSKKITNNIANTTNIDHLYLNNNLSFNATIFERPTLTLRIESDSGLLDTVRIETEPVYNRRGYYSLKDENDEFDDQYLTYDLSFDEMNAFYKSSNNKIIRRGLDNIYHVIGEKEGQISADGIYSGDIVTITANGNAVFTLTANTLSNGDTVQFVNTAPTSFSLNTTYYVVSKTTNGFSLSATSGGVAISTTSTGTFSIKSAISTKYLSKWINDSTGDIYYNKDANTLLIKNVGAFDIKKFEAPGILMIQSNITDFILFTYSSIDISTSAANTYTFKSVSVQYISRNKYPSQISSYNDYFIYDSDKLNNEIVSNPQYFRISGPTYFFFLSGSSIDGLVLYPYSKELRISSDVSTLTTPTGIDININSTATNIVEYYTSSDITGTSPTFTLIPHRKMSQTPIGFFQKSKNHTFVGINSKDAGEYLDLYAWQIINKFNYKLQELGSKAFLIKGESIGEIIINAPGATSIQMYNGHSDNGLWPGTHSFLPELQKSAWITLASRSVTNSFYEANQAVISRRNIPEITPIGSYITIGKSNKKLIGYGTNVDDLYIFKEDGIFRIFEKGDISTNIPQVSVSQLSTNIICQAKGSIKEINDEIIFLSQYGFMSISNGGISNISSPIQRDILTLIQTSSKDRIQAFVNESKQLYYCTLINEVDSTLNVKSGTYIFNTKTREWSFMNQEILDGLEDSNKRNLVAYRQKPILGIGNGISNWQVDTNLHKLTSCDLSYPLQSIDYINYVDDFFYISRERHTNNIILNNQDQYDYISENLMEYGEYQDIIVDSVIIGFTITIPVSKNAFMYHYAQKLFKLSTPPSTIAINSNNYAIVDSAIQMFIDRQIYAKIENGYYEVKLIKFEYIGITDYQIKYTFNYLTSNYNMVSYPSTVNLIAGVPVKITFNPESGNQPDTNKLFQEYMIHTETNNKGAIFTFKTDSRTNLTTDRRFVYDPTATNRNIFRTYIPTNAARGRYLIRQVKHDVPLENLIITGQTIVMRDSGSTRVQKDKDTN